MWEAQKEVFEEAVRAVVTMRNPSSVEKKGCMLM
jgi:hypothetical protein